MKSIVLLIFTIMLVSCSSHKRLEWNFEQVGEPRNQDYVDHLVSLGGDYLKHDETQTIALTKESMAFLEKIYDRIVKNNESILQKKDRPNFFFVINKTPFIFSLPGSRFFISTGIIEKYLKSEELFVAAISAEIIKSQRLIYEKRMFIPKGFCTTENLLSLTRIKPDIKFMVNEWAYFSLKRSGFDASAYLNWIQVQNRNTLDFSMYLGDAIGISREEHNFKNFMSRQGVLGIEKKVNEKNSSKEFYKLLSNIVRS